MDLRAPTDPAAAERTDRTMPNAHRRPKRSPTKTRRSAEKREARIERAADAEDVRRPPKGSAEALALEEARELLKAQRASLPGWWAGPEKRTVYFREGNPYRVIAQHERPQWSGHDPPYRVLSPEGVLLGGSSHLSKAQQLCDVLGEPMLKTALFAAAVGPQDETIAVVPPPPLVRRAQRDAARKLAVVPPAAPVPTAAVPSVAAPDSDSFVDLGEGVSSRVEPPPVPPSFLLAPPRLRKV